MQFYCHTTITMLSSLYVSFPPQTSDMAGLARLATQDPAVALENLPIIVELGDIGNLEEQDGVRW